MGLGNVQNLSVFLILSVVSRTISRTLLVYHPEGVGCERDTKKYSGSDEIVRYFHIMNLALPLPYQNYFPREK